MSIAYGHITGKGQLIAVSDRRETINGVESNDHHEKTFSLCGNRIIGAHTGLLFFNGKRLKDHLEDAITILANSELKIDTLDYLMKYLKDQIQLEEAVTVEHKVIRIIFLMRYRNKPYMHYYTIIPDKDLNELQISKPKTFYKLGTFFPFGNKNAFDTIHQSLGRAQMNKPISETIEIMKSAIRSVIDIDGEISDCGGEPSIQFIR